MTRREGPLSDAAVGGQAPAAIGQAGSQQPGPPDPDAAQPAPVQPEQPQPSASFARRHWLFAAVLAGAAALRAVVMLGYPPVMWFNDSYAYVYEAIHLKTAPGHPVGYPFFLSLLLPLHSFSLVAAAQHLMGLAIGTGSYALLRRRGLPAWGAVLAAVPVLYDAYQVQLEQDVMSDVLFMLLVTAAVLLLCWRDRVSVPAALAAGLAVGYATIVRSAGLPLLAVVAVCLLARRVGWRPVAALLAAGAAPIAGYMILYHLQNGPYAITESGGTFLYGRVMSFADCRVMHPAPSVARLCDPRPPARRPIAVEYIWDKSDPLWKLGHGLFGRGPSSAAQRFAVRAIEAQPLSYLRVVASDTWRAFGWTHSIGYDRKTEVLYQFSDPPPQIPNWGWWPSLHTFEPGLGQPRAGQPFAAFLGGYQRFVYLRGTLLGLILLAGLAGVVARWRDWGGVGLLPWALAATLLVLPIATSGFSYRYLLAVVPAACLAAGLAFARPASAR